MRKHLVVHKEAVSHICTRSLPSFPFLKTFLTTQHRNSYFIECLFDLYMLELQLAVLNKKRLRNVLDHVHCSKSGKGHQGMNQIRVLTRQKKIVFHVFFES